MTAPQEPLKLTLEEAIAHLTEAELFLARDKEYDGWFWFVHDLLKDGVMVTKALTWPEAVSAALGRPVVARDDAAELRAAAKAWAIAERAWSLAETGLDAVEAAETLTEAEVALHAALAATEGQP